MRLGQAAEVGVGVVEAGAQRAVEAEVEAGAEGEALLAVFLEQVAISPGSRSTRARR